MRRLASAPPAIDVSGRWDARIEYAAGASTHVLHLRQKGNELAGTHQGDFVARDRRRARSAAAKCGCGVITVEAPAILWRSRFTGTVSGDEMSGDLDMGEYLSAKWKARRRG